MAKIIDRIRTKNYRGFAMELWINYGKTGKRGRDVYSYKLTTPTGVKFSGTDYMTSPFAIGNKAMILDGLLKFICVKPGDTDDEYFQKYTAEQLEWANSPECEEIRTALDDTVYTVH